MPGSRVPTVLLMGTNLSNASLLALFGGAQEWQRPRSVARQTGAERRENLQRQAGSPSPE